MAGDRADRSNAQTTDERGEKLFSSHVPLQFEGMSARQRETVTKKNVVGLAGQGFSSRNCASVAMPRIPPYYLLLPIQHSQRVTAYLTDVVVAMSRLTEVSIRPPLVPRLRREGMMT